VLDVVKAPPGGAVFSNVLPEANCNKQKIASTTKANTDLEGFAVGFEVAFVGR